MPILSTEQIVSLIVEEPMIENPELTLKILRHIARDDVAFPANLTLEDIQAQFPVRMGTLSPIPLSAPLTPGFLWEVNTGAFALACRRITGSPTSTAFPGLVASMFARLQRTIRRR